MRKQLIIMVVVLVSAMVSARMANASGEAKNQAPFTTLVSQDQTSGLGEAKNEAPFTAAPGSAPDVFERYAAQHPYGRGVSTTATVSKAGSGVEWRYVIGGGSIGALLVSGLVVLGSRRRSHIGTLVDA